MLRAPLSGNGRLQESITGNSPIKKGYNFKKLEMIARTDKTDVMKLKAMQDADKIGTFMKAGAIKRILDFPSA